MREGDSDVETGENGLVVQGKTNCWAKTDDVA